MSTFPEGRAIVYCQGNFNTPNGKTAHGLVRHTRRYDVLSVIDRKYSGADAGEVLDGSPSGIPVYADLDEALANSGKGKRRATHWVLGLAPDGGRLDPQARSDAIAALKLGLNVDAGLHDFLSEHADLQEAADSSGAKIRDVRRPPDRSMLHFFSGKIEQVDSYKIALLGTDSAVGKRTTAWLLVDGTEEEGMSAELVGTGQTAWLQGARHGIILDSLINDFVAGELEHAVWSAWRERRPQAIVVEGQGSLLNPAYPGGFEILAATRPNAVVLQHAPARREYDGFPGYPIHRLHRQIEAIEIVSDRPVVAITLNHENLNREQLDRAADRIEQETGLPTLDPLYHGVGRLVALVRKLHAKR